MLLTLEEGETQPCYPWGNATLRSEPKKGKGDPDFQTTTNRHKAIQMKDDQIGGRNKSYYVVKEARRSALLRRGYGTVANGGKMKGSGTLQEASN